MTGRRSEAPGWRSSLHPVGADQGLGQEHQVDVLTNLKCRTTASRLLRTKPFWSIEEPNMNLTCALPILHSRGDIQMLYLLI